ncbi:Transcriptional regulator, contains XRE-family HTH domain [Nocardiopsis flavescens]|uniref:Transcriptional regulator, contains XRE-family HTH domain n=1 Tax=Nocardiopsis flavescens TaxID=758803 RepID=A0A1M6KHX4_9ACTN|nr:helix-turn-helix domain-containing protein [Nocardiopsis flavescens]SHJ58558.1 Transcriptional regulator, contains XRE-family HTH domain [Nocardiopsis flavescens]
MEHLGVRLAQLRRVADLTQEGLAERSGVSVDVVRKLEQQRKHSARLPTLHALATGLGVELTTLLGDPPAVPSNGDAEPPQLVALRRAIMPPLFAPPAPRDAAESLSLPLLRAEVSDGWSLYHGAQFGRLLDVLPGIIADARLAAAVGSGHSRAEGEHALGKALQLAGHLAIRLGKTDLALASLERAAGAADNSGDPLLAPMVFGSVAWAYQRQNRLDDAGNLVIHAADGVEREVGTDTAASLRVWGGLVMSGATSAARSGDYEQAKDMMATAEQQARRLPKLPPPRDGRSVSIFSRSSVRIERVRLAVQHKRPDEALELAKGMRLSADTPPSWRTWLLLDVARAYTDVGDAHGAVAALQRLRRASPDWMRHHTLAVAIIQDLYAGPVQPPGLRQLAEFVGVTP